MPDSVNAPAGSLLAAGAAALPRVPFSAFAAAVTGDAGFALRSVDLGGDVVLRAGGLSFTGLAVLAAPGSVAGAAGGAAGSVSETAAGAGALAGVPVVWLDACVEGGCTVGAAGVAAGRTPELHADSNNTPAMTLSRADRAKGTRAVREKRAAEDVAANADFERTGESPQNAKIDQLLEADNSKVTSLP